MGSAYSLGYLFGKFVAGCICGLLPVIISIIKKRVMLGIVLMVICGLAGFIQPVISVAVAVVSGIVLCFMKKNV